jgi:NAD(P)H-hydrate epimerase
MSGAAILCGSGALRGGAGLVRVSVPESILPIVAGANPCYLTAALPEDENGLLAGTAANELVMLAKANNVVALGPGLGRSQAIARLVSTLIARTDVPLVIDADGLNALEDQTDILKKRSAPLVLTPHPGEFARLAKKDVPTIQSKREELAVQFASEHELVLVLKGHHSVVTDGRQVFINTTGNPGMATGGTGDVLTGLIAALIGQGLDEFAAAQLGVHVHGFAGDLARDEIGEVSLIASDLLEYLPHVFRKLLPA